MNILFTNAGRRTYLIEFAIDICHKFNYPIEIFVSDTNINTPTFWVSPEVNTIILPMVSSGEKNYVENLLKECKRNNIKAIIPLMDFELPIISKNKKKFEDNEIQVVISEYDTILNTLDKVKCALLCKKVNIPAPQSYFKYEEIPNDKKIVRKKILGSGSIGLSFHNDKSSLLDFKEGVEMAQEMIDGQEYGLDILNDLKGNFVHAAFRKKISMRSGETDKAEVIESAELEDFARHLSTQLKHVGNLDVDVMMTANNEIYCIDINPRFGGGYPFTHYAGLNYLQLIFDMLLNQELKIPTTFKKIVGMKGIKMFFYEKN